MWSLRSLKSETGFHKLSIDYPWLRRYIIFLSKLFDDNEELEFTFPTSVPSPSFEQTSREQLLEIANTLESKSSLLADQLRFYAYGAIDHEYIPMPTLVIHQDNQEEKALGFAFPNANGQLSIPLKKDIFCTPGFAQFFAQRNEFIHDLFSASLKAIIAHEVAHVARGHWNLRETSRKLLRVRDVFPR